MAVPAACMSCCLAACVLPRRVRDSLPPTFEEALQAATGGWQAAAATGSAASAAAARYRHVQSALVLGQVQELVCRSLVGWITQVRAGRRCRREQVVLHCLAEHRHTRPCLSCWEQGCMHAGLAGHAAALPPRLLQGSPADEGAGADGAPACPPGLMRFGAHLALSLWALGIAEVAEG